MSEQRLCIACQRRDCIHVVPPSADEVLSRTEERVLRLLAEGEDNLTIADLLQSTEGTVKVHVSRIYRKLHVSGKGHSRVRAALWVREHPELHLAA